MIERQPIRAAKCRALHRAFGFGIVAVGAPGHDQNIPLKACGGRIGTLFVPVHDVPKHVVGTRVSGVDRCLALFTAIAVVGERTVDAAAGVRVDRYPLRAIHFVAPTTSAARRVLISRSPRLAKPLLLSGPFCPKISGSQSPLPSSLNWRRTACRTSAAAYWLPGSRDRIFCRRQTYRCTQTSGRPHVDHHAIIGGERDGGPSCLKRPSAVCLRGWRSGCRIDLHHPAETVGFVRVLSTLNRSSTSFQRYDSSLSLMP